MSDAAGAFRFSVDGVTQIRSFKSDGETWWGAAEQLHLSDELVLVDARANPRIGLARTDSRWMISVSPSTDERRPSRERVARTFVPFRPRLTWLPCGPPGRRCGNCNPTSLSYQLTTLISLPVSPNTCVRSAAKIELCGSSMMSDDTMGSSVLGQVALQGVRPRLA